MVEPFREYKHATTLKKARVMVRRDLRVDIWSEQHFGIIINSNDWGAQIWDHLQRDCEMSMHITPFVEWFPYNSRCVRIELI